MPSLHSPTISLQGGHYFFFFFKLYTFLPLSECRLCSLPLPPTRAPVSSGEKLLCRIDIPVFYVHSSGIGHWTPLDQLALEASRVYAPGPCKTITNGERVLNCLSFPEHSRRQHPEERRLIMDRLLTKHTSKGQR